MRDSDNTDLSDIEDVRLAIYRRFAATGRPSSPEEVSQELGLSGTATADAFAKLHVGRHIVLDEAGTVVLAHPFASRNFAFSVMGEGVLWWGGCAWDAFAIPHLVVDEPKTLVATSCPNCGRPLAWNVDRFEETKGSELVHFLVPMARVWDDVLHACGNQRIYCDEACLADWLDRTGEQRGAAFDIPSLWRLASGWYAGRLDVGYRRREPAQAAEYFKQAGLLGPFWGN